MEVKKNYTEVLIDGKVYTMGGNEDTGYLQKIASYVNHKLKELRSQAGFSKLEEDYQQLMLEINMADDYFKAQEKADELKRQKEEIERDVYGLKHDLINAQIKLEKAQGQIEELESALSKAVSLASTSAVARAGQAAERRYSENYLVKAPAGNSADEKDSPSRETDWDGIMVEDLDDYDDSLAGKLLVPEDISDEPEIMDEPDELEFSERLEGKAEVAVQLEEEPKTKGDLEAPEVDDEGKEESDEEDELEGAGELEEFDELEESGELEELDELEENSEPEELDELEENSEPEELDELEESGELEELDEPEENSEPGEFDELEEWEEIEESDIIEESSLAEEEAAGTAEAVEIGAVSESGQDKNETGEIREDPKASEEKRRAKEEMEKQKALIAAKLAAARLMQSRSSQNFSAPLQNRVHPRNF